MFINRNFLLSFCIGTILGSLILLSSYSLDWGSLIILLSCVNLIVFVSKHKLKESILTATIALILLLANYQFRTDQLRSIDWSSMRLNDHRYYFVVSNQPKQKFYQDQLILERRHSKPNLGESFQELLCPERIISTSPSRYGLIKNDLVKAQIKNPNKPIIKKLTNDFYANQKIFNRLTNVDIEYAGHKDSFVDGLQIQIKNFYFKTLSPENAAITCSLLLGTKVAEEPKQIVDQLWALGLGHVFSASGFHVLLLVLLITWICNLPWLQIKPNIKTITIIFVLSIYSGLAGFSPSIIRAVFGTGIYLLIQSFKRRARTISVLLISAGVLLIFDPYTIWDIGFQFSYLATLSILIWSNPIKESLVWIKVPDYFKEIIIVSIASQILMFPLVIFYFHNLQIWSLLSNLIFTPILSLVTLASFLGLSFIITPLLEVFKSGVKIFANLPWLDNYIELNFFSWILLTLISILISQIVFRNFKPRFLAIHMSLLFSFMLFFTVLNINPINTPRIKITVKYLKDLELKAQGNYRYFRILGLETLLIKDLSSLKKLGKLQKDLHEVSILILSKLNSNTIYLDTILKITKPQFVIYSSRSTKAKHNLDLLGRNFKRINNNETLYISDGKYWKIEKN